MSDPDTASKRSYRMTARAQATEATRERILDAAELAFEELPFDEITLAAVAKGAGVSVQTVLRHFDNREGLFVATLLRSGAEMAADRGVLPSGDLDEVIAALVDHYEKYGNRVLHLLAQEEREPTLRVLADLGRNFHHEWCEQAFSPALRGLRGAKRERRLAQFVAGTDIHVWKLLRRDSGLSHAQTKLAMRELLAPLAGPAR
jgi:AcrR family transcriptional regulator